MTAWVKYKSTGMSSRLNWASIHSSGCPAVCRCWSSHVEQRERSSTSHLPAGAHSSLENQVSPFWIGDAFGGDDSVAAGRGITRCVSGDRREVSIYQVSITPDSLSADRRCAGGEAVYRLQYPQSDHKNNPEAMWVIMWPIAGVAQFLMWAWAKKKCHTGSFGFLILEIPYISFIIGSL